MSKIFLRKQQVAARYNVNTRTIDRWSEDGRLPPPIYRGIVPLWDQAELDGQDHAAAATARAAGKLKTTADADTKSEAPTAA
jgi:predicted DNA-binding transcriptional regulator AlpA